MSIYEEIPIKEMTLFRILKTEDALIRSFNTPFIGADDTIGIFHAFGMNPDNNDTLYYKPITRDVSKLLGFIVTDKEHRDGTVRILYSFRLFNN